MTICRRILLPALADLQFGIEISVRSECRIIDVGLGEHAVLSSQKPTSEAR